MTVIFALIGWLNTFGWIIAGIWLAILREWSIIGWGIAPIFLPTAVFSLVFLPSIIFAFPAGYLLERGFNSIGMMFVVLGALYNNAVVSVWCTFVLYFFLTKADRASFVPTLLWSYAAATAPLVDLTLSELRAGGDAEAGRILTLFAQIGYIVVMAVLLLSAGVTVLTAALVFFAIMILGFLIQCSRLLKQRPRESGVGAAV